MPCMVSSALCASMLEPTMHVIVIVILWATDVVTILLHQHNCRTKPLLGKVFRV